MRKRAVIKTGFDCNNNCRFCVAAWSKKLGNRTTDELKRELEDARKSGCTDAQFSGGEVTIRQDFLELMRYAKGLGFASVEVQTNGRMFASMQFCKDAVSAGMNLFNPALHGHVAELHDYLTRSPGSFGQTVQGIKNCKMLGVRISTNSVIVKPNYRYAPELAQLLVSLGVSEFQLAFVHPVGNAFDNFDAMVPWMGLCSLFMRKAMQVGMDAGVTCFVEAMPFCQMQGYERLVAELHVPAIELRDIDAFTPDYATVRSGECKQKFPQCSQCRYDLLCEGPWKEYAEKRGSDEFVPVLGEKIKNPADVTRGL